MRIQAIVNLPPTSGIRRHLGISLVELMVGLTVGLLIVGAVTALFARSSRFRQEMEKTSQQVENGRYATQLLLDDFHLAGYYGEYLPPSPSSTMPNACATDVSNLVAAMPLHLQGYDDAPNDTLSTCISDLKQGTDIVVIRRASTCACNITDGQCFGGLVTGLGSGTLGGTFQCDPIDTNKYTYFQTTLCPTDVSPTVVIGSNFTLKKKDCLSLAALRAYYVRIYFIASNNKPGDGIPTLKVAELGKATPSPGAPPAFSIAPLVAGIEQLQLEYGIDSDGDGDPNAYTAAPDTHNGCSASSCQATNWRSVIAVKMHILARNTEASPSFKDTRTYILGKLADGVTDKTFGPYDDAYKRHVYTAVARLNNVAGRLE